MQKVITIHGQSLADASNRPSQAIEDKAKIGNICMIQRFQCRAVAVAATFFL